MDNTTRLKVYYDNNDDSFLQRLISLVNKRQYTVKSIFYLSHEDSLIIGVEQTGSLKVEHLILQIKNMHSCVEVEVLD